VGDVPFDNDNRDGVARGPRRATVVDLKTPALISRIRTCHRNDGHDTVAAGTIALRAADGRTFGPWAATGLPGRGEAPDADWECFPDVGVPAGRYTVVDSDRASWAWNDRTGGAGIANVEGWPQEGTTERGSNPSLVLPIL
jgi:hypothetical protein